MKLTCPFSIATVALGVVSTDTMVNPTPGPSMSLAKTSMTMVSPCSILTMSATALVADPTLSPSVPSLAGEPSLLLPPPLPSPSAPPLPPSPPSPPLPLPSFPSAPPPGLTGVEDDWPVTAKFRLSGSSLLIEKLSGVSPAGTCVPAGRFGSELSTNNKYSPLGKPGNQKRPSSLVIASAKYAS